MLELLKGLPVRAEDWVRSRINRFTWKWLFKTLTKIVLFFIFAAIVGGVVEGTSYDFWKTEVLPWLRSTRSTRNSLLAAGGVFCICGWAVASLSGLIAFLSYGADRRRLGQLETVGEENAEREQKINELNTEIGRLSAELQKTEQTGSQLLTLFSGLDRELLTLLVQDNLDDRIAVHAFYESACRRLFKYLGRDSHLFRASIYLSDEKDPEFLVIMWDYGVGEVSRRWNRWYVGDHDPEALGVHRGIPGDVFVKGQSRVNTDAKADPAFHDPHQPPRSVLPYKPILHTVIHPNDPSSRYGVFCVDCLTYEFTDKDLEIAQQVAIRLGWLLYRLQIDGTLHTWGIQGGR